MAKLVPSLDLVRRTVAIEAAHTLSRVQVLERLPGNPVGIAYRQPEEGLVALMARHFPVPFFNTVYGLRGGRHLAHIGPLVAWYREHGVKPRFEVVPGLADEEIARELARHGFCQTGFHTALGCAPGTISPGDTTAIERVADTAVLEAFLGTHAAGWQIPDPAGFKANVRGWLGLPGWSLYLARADDEPAATGILYVRDKVGYCADAATVPAFRGRGLQTALLRRRITDAFASGVDFVCSGAAFMSGSHRNMERAGMQLLFTRALWTLS